MWTLAVVSVDVKPVGVNGTSVGFATLNTWFHNLTGVNMTLYNITDWAGFGLYRQFGFLLYLWFGFWLRYG